jgi:hypothetical protein
MMELLNEDVMNRDGDQQTMSGMMIQMILQLGWL